jgi:hypothetical protein
LGGNRLIRQKKKPTMNANGRKPTSMGSNRCLVIFLATYDHHELDEIEKKEPINFLLDLVTEKFTLQADKLQLP